LLMEYEYKDEYRGEDGSYEASDLSGDEQNR
jgi:hypothetical protein